VFDGTGQRKSTYAAFSLVSQNVLVAVLLVARPLQTILLPGCSSTGSSQSQDSFDERPFTQNPQQRWEFARRRRKAINSETCPRYYFHRSLFNSFENSKNNYSNSTNMYDGSWRSRVTTHKCTLSLYTRKHKAVAVEQNVVINKTQSTANNTVSKHLIKIEYICYKNTW